MVGNSSDILKFQYLAFESVQDILDYIEHPDYMMTDDHPGICFGFSVTNSSSDDFEIQMLFNDQIVQEDAQTIPY